MTKPYIASEVMAELEHGRTTRHFLFSTSCLYNFLCFYMHDPRSMLFSEEQCGEMFIEEFCDNLQKYYHSEDWLVSVGHNHMLDGHIYLDVATSDWVPNMRPHAIVMCEGGVFSILPPPPPPPSITQPATIVPYNVMLVVEGDDGRLGANIVSIGETNFLASAAHGVCENDGYLILMNASVIDGHYQRAFVADLTTLPELREYHTVVAAKNPRILTDWHEYQLRQAIYNRMLEASYMPTVPIRPIPQQVIDACNTKDN